MKKKKPTPYSNPKSKALSNIVFDEYFDMFSFKTKPVSDTFIDHIAQELVTWVLSDDKAYKLSQFYVKKGIGSDDIKRWENRNKNLLRAHAFALEVLSIRREIGALERKLDPGMVRYTMPHYDKTWKELEEWRAKLKELQQFENEGTKFVVLQPTPSSDIVPPKKISEGE